MAFRLNHVYMPLVCLLALQAVGSDAQYSAAHFQGERSTIVHLFEWTWPAIARECEQFLGPAGYAGVQISPPNENVIVAGRPWYERYQPISYKLRTRSGGASALREMIARCNRAGVRVYVDAVINHMTGPNANGALIGTANSTADYAQRSYPAVPFEAGDFNWPCGIQNYGDAMQVRNCQLSGLLDLNQGVPHVRSALAKYLNRLIDMGVAGFRVDAAKHMWPGDLEILYALLRDLKQEHGFPAGARPFIYQEVIDNGEGISTQDYTQLGRVTEFRLGQRLGNIFRGNDQLKWLRNWGPEWGLLRSEQALVFIDNHDNQRGHGGGGSTILTHADGDIYKLASAFMLAHPYGLTRVMSSYAFETPSQGPPTSDGARIGWPTQLPNGQCNTQQSGWICEHRWPEIANMVQFRNVAGGAPLVHWWNDESNQIAFGRAGRAFIAINMDRQKALTQPSLQTGLPAGLYCNILQSGWRFRRNRPGACAAHVEVNADGTASIDLPQGPSALAIHVEATK